MTRGGHGAPQRPPADLWWRKSSRSNGDGNVCVEVAHMAVSIAVRDSKNPGTAITIPVHGWVEFLHAVAGSGTE